MDPLDRLGCLFSTEDNGAGQRSGSVLILPSDAARADDLAARLAERTAPLRLAATPHLSQPGRPFVHQFGSRTAVVLPGGPLRGRHVGERYANIRASREGQLALLQGGLTALAALHALDPPLVHGFVGPEALFLDEDGRPTLVGAGLDELGLNPGWSVPPVPEEERSPASDLYQLGLTTLAAAAGVAPHLLVDPFGSVLWNPEWDVHPLVKALLQRMTSPELARRPSNAIETLPMLERVQDALGSHPEAAEMLHEVLTGAFDVTLDESSLRRALPVVPADGADPPLDGAPAPVAEPERGPPPPPAGSSTGTRVLAVAAVLFTVLAVALLWFPG